MEYQWKPMKNKETQLKTPGSQRKLIEQPIKNQRESMKSKGNLRKISEQTINNQGDRMEFPYKTDENKINQ